MTGITGRWSVWVVAATASLAAQAPASPAFDVASVKPNRSVNQETASFVQPGGRYTATNVTVRMLVKAAYGLHDDQLIGGPEWVKTDRFDISAKAEGYSTPSAFRDAARLMLRPLLASRFKLVLREERRDLPVYVLTFASANRMPGPLIRPTNPADCDSVPKTPAAARDAVEPATPLLCGAEIYRAGHLEARGMALSFFALNLSRWTDRVVVDETGLDGKFDWDLQWVPEDQSSANPAAFAGPSLVDALREQAGLKFETARRRVVVRIIEHIEPPDPD